MDDYICADCGWHGPKQDLLYARPTSNAMILWHVEAMACPRCRSPRIVIPREEEVKP